MIINVRSATFIMPEGKPKRKKEEVKEERGDSTTLKNRCIAQNFIRVEMFKILDSIGRGDMSKYPEEIEFWKKALWDFSDKCTDFYGKKHKLPVWNH